MGTDFMDRNSSQNTLDKDSQLASLLKKCNRCGFCQSVCPTYKHSKNELQVARGRIRLIRLLSEGKLSFKEDPDARDMVDSCLMCKACVVNCPASVQTDQIILQARQALHKIKGFSVLHRIVYHGVLSSTQKLNLVNAMLRLYEKSGLRRMVDRSVLEKASRTLKHAVSLIPAHCEKPAIRDLPVNRKVDGQIRYNICFFVGCATNILGRSVVHSAIKYLQYKGCNVIIPEQGCCGGPHFLAGDIKEAKDLAQKTVQRIFTSGYDAIISDCPTCIHTFLQYKDFFSSDDPIQLDIKSFQGKIFDLNSFIAEYLLENETLESLPYRVTYHDSCHAIRGINVSKEPRNLLKQITGLELVEMESPDSCCGGAGSYCFTHPFMSSCILEDKINDILSTTSDIVATSCPICTLQIKAGLRQKGKQISVKHPVELLAESAKLGV